MSSCSLRNLTLKTAFLLLLASAKRVSELHGISYDVLWALDGSSATLSLSPDFVAKTQIPGDPSSAYKPFVIPALASSVGHDEPDRLLCPLRALKCYLQRTVSSRPKCSRLFVSSASTLKHKQVTKNTISLWIRSVIKAAYSSVSQEDLSLWKITAHEVRAIATSILFRQNQSLKQVMSAASWKSNSTFVSFYLRDLNHKSLDLSSIGPIVAAQAIVNPQASTSSDPQDPRSISSRSRKEKGRGVPQSKLRPARN